METYSFQMSFFYETEAVASEEFHQHLACRGQPLLNCLTSEPASIGLDVSHTGSRASTTLIQIINFRSTAAFRSDTFVSYNSAICSANGRS